MTLPSFDIHASDMAAFAGECAAILYFFGGTDRRTESRLSPLGYVCLAALAGLYTSAAQATVQVASAYNFAIQLLRMLYHAAAVYGYAVLCRELSRRSAAYLAGLFTVLYLAGQNARFISMILAPPEWSGMGYRVVFAVLGEWLFAFWARRALDLPQIRPAGGVRWAILCAMLLLELYFKWSLIAIQVGTPQNASQSALLVFAFCAAVGAAAVQLLFETNQQAVEQKARAEAEQLSMGYEMQNAKRALQTNNDIRRLYHDMKNHLLAIDSLAGDSAELKAYLRELLPRFEGYETRVSTGSQVVDALLSEKIQRAALDGIRFSVCMDLHALDFMRSVDLITIFGNAADNAIEAVQMLPTEEERVIYLKQSRFANMEVLRFDNRFAGAISLRGGLPVTGKRETTLHGIGLRSIQKVVQRYGGTLSTEFSNEEKWFRLVLMIPAEPVRGSE